MATKEPGYVYILTNPSFREDWVKIGMTQNMDERLRTLDTTALPLPFKKYATLQTVKYEKAEKHVHHYIETFTNLRIRDKREFFNVKPEQALKIFCEVAELLDDAIVTRYEEDGTPIPVYPPCPPKPANTIPVKQLDKPKTAQKRAPKVWMVPASPKYFDHRACFDELGYIYWKQYNNLQAGDTGFIYMSAPVKTVIFKFEVVACDLSYTPDYDKEKKFYKREEDFESAKKHNRYYLMKRVGEHKKGVLTLANMKKNGLKGAPMGTLNLSDESFKELLGYIERNFSDMVPTVDNAVTNMNKTSKKKKINKTEYSIDGINYYNKSRFVPFIVKTFVEKHREMTFAQLKELFPDTLLGSNFRRLGVLVRKEDIDASSRDIKDKQKWYYVKDETSLVRAGDGVQFYINNQWTIETIQPILKIAEKEGWTIYTK